MAIERKYPKILVPVPELEPMFSFEGIDGSGKTTQVVRVTQELIKREIEAKSVKSPSYSPLGNFIRENLQQLQPWVRSTLFLLDTIAILRQYDRSGKILLWDRYKDSHIISNKDMTPEEATRWHAPLPDPAKTFLLDIDPRIVREKRSLLDTHSFDMEWQLLKHERYRELANKEAPRIVVIDATQKKEVITEFITSTILDELERLGIIWEKIY